jgi:hypothetical protein
MFVSSWAGEVLSKRLRSAATYDLIALLFAILWYISFLLLFFVYGERIRVFSIELGLYPWILPLPVIPIGFLLGVWCTLRGFNLYRIVSSNVKNFIRLILSPQR